MCGIFAIINGESKPFDYQSFCTLGCANDRRGGDSCGIFIDGKTEYGIKDTAKFEDFFWGSKLLKDTKEATICLGHDRKASPGMEVNLQNAHPIVIEEEVGEGENAKKEVKFVMVHNGTIYNYKELAKKYIPNIDITGMTDSHVIARLLYYSGFDWLAEYNGGTAFIAVDYRKEKPQILIWRGKSKKSSTSTEMEDERPLYCNLKNGRLVLSSVGSYLAIVDGDCYAVPENMVLTYHDNNFFYISKIDRSKAQQIEKVSYYSGNTYTGNNNYTTYKYIKTNFLTNLYKVGDVLADGYLRITSYGKVLGKYDSFTAAEQQHQIYFFCGIPLMDKKAYIFLNKAWKRTKLNLEDFVKTYQNLIRFFSTDQLYYHEDKLYRASSPWDRQLFTGYLQMLSDAQAYRFLLGIRQTYEYKVNTIYDGFTPLKEERNYDYKTIWKEFIQSIG